MGRLEKTVNLKCERCNRPTRHELRKTEKNPLGEYFCIECGKKKFLGFPEYVCHYHNQKRCLIEDMPSSRMNTTYCLGCPHFY